MAIKFTTLLESYLLSILSRFLRHDLENFFS